MPHRRYACHLCQHSAVSSQLVLHGPKPSLKCTARSLECSLASLIIKFCKQLIVAGAFLFKQLLDFLMCFNKPVMVLPGRRANNFSGSFLWYCLDEFVQQDTSQDFAYNREYSDALIV